MMPMPRYSQLELLLQEAKNGVHGLLGAVKRQLVGQ